MQIRLGWIAGLIACAVLMAKPVFAEPTTNPARAPEERDLPDKHHDELQKRVDKLLNRRALPTTLPTVEKQSAPTTGPHRLPTPAELYEKMKLAAAKRAALLKVAYIDLNQPVSEKPADFSFFGGETGLTLHSLLDRLATARDDKNVRAVLVNIGETSVGMAQAMEIRDQLKDVVRAGKKVFVYSDSYDTTSYIIASAATDVCLLPGGEIMVPGVNLETMFYKGALDKIGVQADYIQIGEFKGAEEPYTRTEPSDELRGELTRLTEALYEQTIDAISIGRSVSREAVKQLIDDTILTAAAAKDRGFVDHLADQDALRELIKDELGGDIEVLKEYGAAKRPEVDLSNPFAFLASISKRPEPSEKPTIAIIYAEGTIVDGSGAGGLLGGGGVGSDPMRRAFRQALRDENVKAVVLRIDSPGGSALASEVMWQSARRLAAEKPLIISIGGMAASGGYYLASAGDYIFADPAGIVGSIGVVGGKFVTKDLYDKVGLTTESFTKGRNAGLFSSTEPWSDRQRRMVRNWMQQTYDQFTQRVMTTRSGKIQDIDKVARGRIFLARDAKALGMIDELGGTRAAIQYAAKEAELEAGEYDVRPVPGPTTLADYLGMGGGSDDQEVIAPMRSAINIQLGSDSLLNALSPEVRASMTQQIQMLQLLQRRPIVLMSPFVVRVK